ncbi:MAG: hypothetical protein ACYDCI_02735 [Candidatus Limnocylindrales bacterium]
MTVQEQQSVIAETPMESATPATGVQSTRTIATRDTTTQPGGAETARRIVGLIFGLIQIVIALRIVLLLLDARAGNAIVSGILNISQVFVGPFEGILHSDALQSGGALLDMAAILALIGWTIVELIVMWAVGIFRRERV